MASTVKQEGVNSFEEKSEGGKKEEYVETDKNYVTPKKQIKSSADIGVGITKFDITQEALFDEAPTTDPGDGTNKQASGQAKGVELSQTDAKEEEGKDDGPYAYLRKILNIDDLGKQIVDVIDTTRLQE